MTRGQLVFLCHCMKNVCVICLLCCVWRIFSSLVLHTLVLLYYCSIVGVTYFMFSDESLNSPFKSQLYSSSMYSSRNKFLVLFAILTRLWKRHLSYFYFVLLFCLPLDMVFGMLTVKYTASPRMRTTSYNSLSVRSAKMQRWYLFDLKC